MDAFMWVELQFSPVDCLPLIKSNMTGWRKHIAQTK